METQTIITSIVFAIGVSFLLFGKDSNPENDVIGFILIIASFIFK